MAQSSNWITACKIIQVNQWNTLYQITDHRRSRPDSQHQPRRRFSLRDGQMEHHCRSREWRIISVTWRNLHSYSSHLVATVRQWQRHSSFCPRGLQPDLAQPQISVERRKSTLLHSQSVESKHGLRCLLRDSSRYFRPRFKIMKKNPPGGFAYPLSSFCGKNLFSVELVSD